MSLNWREIALIVSELPLEGSLIQRVHQIGFNTLIFELHHPQKGFWQLYVEVGTPHARLHRLSGSPKTYRKQKTPKLQRFIQYIRAHIEGGRISAVSQPEQDRILLLHVHRAQSLLYLVLRFYSGPQANIIICDEHMMIRELLFRRPNRDDVAGNQLVIPQRAATEDDNRFPVRPYLEEESFNSFIENSYAKPVEQKSESLVEQVEALRDTKIAELKARLTQATYKVNKCADYDSYRISGDLLSSASSLVQVGQPWVTVPDYMSAEEGSTATIALDETLSVGENIAHYYKKLQKRTTAWEHAEQEKQTIEQQIAATQRYFAQLLTPQEGETTVDEEKLRRLLRPTTEQPKTQQHNPYANAPGLRFTSSLFTILVGRNAKENEVLLRRFSRGNDWWLHTRDVPGGYVIIKTIAGKTIPLDTILDAGNLAVLYSKAKEARKADLDYTQVKYLKRPNGGKQGLVLPTQEKNITIQLDEQRLKRLFSDQESGEEPWTM